MDFSKIDRITEEFIKERAFPSAVVSVFDREKTLYRAAYGSNLLPDGTLQKVNTDTAYDMASCTKIATATQIMDLMDAGELRLETRIPEVLTEIKSRPRLYERLRSVTLYQLLTHTSGILDWYPFYVQCGKDYFDVFESFIGDTKIVDGMEYSDMNFMLLGMVISRVKGKALEDCVLEFRDKLGAERMQYKAEADPSFGGNIAPSCWGNDIEEEMVAERGLTFDGWRSQDKPVIGCNDGNAHYFLKDVAGHAGITANADAYERLCRYYMTTDSALLKRAMTEQESGRGLGFQIDEGLYPGGCGHTGFTGTSIYINDAKGIGCVLLTNRLAFDHYHGVQTQPYRRQIAAVVNEIL